MTALVEQIRQSQHQRQAAYRKLVEDTVADRATATAAEAESIIQAAGQTVDSFAAEVSARRSRAAQRARVTASNHARDVRLPELNRQVEAANKRLEEAIAAARAARDEVVGPLAAEIEAIHAETMACQNIERSLRTETAPKELLQKARRLQLEINHLEPIILRGRNGDKGWQIDQANEKAAELQAELDSVRKAIWEF